MNPEKKTSPSYWEAQSFLSGIDALVIGSGLVGLHAALELKLRAPAWRVVVVDRGPLPLGASTRNAGFACFGSMTELIDDQQHLSDDEVWSLVEMRWRGLQHLRQTLGDERLGYQPHGGLELFTASDAESYAACAERRGDFNRALRGITGREETFVLADERLGPLGLGQAQHLIVNQAEGQLHPGQMMYHLLALARERGLELMGGLPIAALHPDANRVGIETSAGWTFTVPRVVVATNGFARRLLPELPVQPARNQVLLTASIPGLKLQGAFHYDRGYVYFRDIDGRVLIGGARNLDPEGETTDQWGHTEAIEARLMGILREVALPGQAFDIEYRWSGILGVGETKRPLVEALHPHLVVAVRLGGMGVAIGSEVGRLAAGRLLG